MSAPCLSIHKISAFRSRSYYWPTPEAVGPRLRIRRAGPLPATSLGAGITFAKTLFNYLGNHFACEIDSSTLPQLDDSTIDGLIRSSLFLSAHGIFFGKYLIHIMHCILHAWFDEWKSILQLFPAITVYQRYLSLKSHFIPPTKSIQLMPVVPISFKIARIRTTN